MPPAARDTPRAIPPRPHAASAVRAAHDVADHLLESLGWSNAQALVTVSPSYRSLVVAMAALRRLGQDRDPQPLLGYARLMRRYGFGDRE